MPIREVRSADGTAIVYRVTGPEDARPLLLIHGWSANLQCWGAAADDLAKRYRVIAMDLRGHGYSDAPESGYNDSANWAADVAAVLDGEGITSDAVLLGWSYGGLVISDYLSVHGTGAIGGVVLVGAITGIGPGQPGGMVGPAMKAAIPGVFEERSGAALRAFGAFGNAMTGAGEDKGIDAQRMFGASLGTLPRVRKALFVRTLGHDEVLRNLNVPALIIHGTADPVADVSAGEHAAQLIPNVRTSFWEGAQHGPFIEDRDRFVGEVTEFVDALG
ncbi:alpha/beta fold hydrolase [Aldersonia kunmingensis]|uniref:alpha/beta fold hydrolase n=1 Tax=Aldersonia kunmingensis TaxID=408066 RepID=UPI000835C760|nr:alpha/beta hydrolase [Aldersonia kunmingensis]